MADHAFVVPAYGDSPFLPACLASLAAQRAGSRIVLATSTPSDFIAQAADAIGAPVKVNSVRAGIASDWNFALAQAGARYVTLAHQDDVYFPGFLAASLGLLEASPQAAVAFTGYVEIDDHGAPIQSKISLVKHALERLTLGDLRQPSKSQFKSFLSFGNPLPCSSVTFDFANLPGFAFSDAFRSNLDWDAWLRLADAGATFVRTPERLMGRRHNPLTATSALIREGVRAREDLTIFRRLWPRPLADLIAFAYRAGY